MPDLSRSLFSGMVAASTRLEQRLSILIYHRVVSQRDWMRPNEPTGEEFLRQMQLMKRYFNVLPLVDAVRLLKEKRLPPRAVCVTFDDGYADNQSIALPILQEVGVPATVFVAASYLNGGRMWNDTIVEAFRSAPDSAIDLTNFGLPQYTLDNRTARRKSAYDVIGKVKYLVPERRKEVAAAVASHAASLPDNLMLDSGQLQSLYDSGVEIGGHTLTHPILTCLTEQQAAREIGEGKEALETLVGGRLRLFAYPNGRLNKDYNEQHVNLVREAGFEAAVSTNWGVSSQATDLFQLPRFTPWDRTPARFLFRMVQNLRHTG